MPVIPMGLTAKERIEWVTALRRSQGLPDRITDDDTLEKLALIILNQNGDEVKENAE